MSHSNRHSSQSSMALCDLPPEMIGEIASHLDLSDLLNVHLVCHYLKDATVNRYERAKIANLRTDFSRESLARLEKLSNSHLAPHVKELNIVGKPVWWTCRLGTGLAWRRRDGRLVSDQESIRRWGEVIRGFPNCTSFSFPMTKPTDYNFATSPGQRDNGQAESGETAPRLIFPRLLPGETFDDALTTTDAYMVLIHIITQAQIPIKSLTILEHEEGGLDQDRIDTAHLDDPAFTAAWSNLRELRLKPSYNFHMETVYLPRLMSAATNLETLSIQLTDGGRNLIKALGSDSPSQTFKLKRLSITEGHVLHMEPLEPHEPLSQLIAPHRETLEHLTISNLEFKWASPNLFLSRLSNIGMSKLRSLYINKVTWDSLREQQPETEIKGLTFPSIAHGQDLVLPRTKDVRYTLSTNEADGVEPATSEIRLEGEDMSSAVEALRQAAVV
ncbi:uncharacterized protein DSM5745_09485 [Aspergillus mulundensis]|uniref:F-box domain-containing protein n=1 Tax=Aspergillus mulundensis TaxID=1810919 RepID=A0A3D8QV74_9EURO|nr:hypothetical protein DSM5745_09485 [Aspergillus mulundensis]RDW65746.1 hypothetical protein DSM5745_09485 [Aspergillus mulundensis]